MTLITETRGTADAGIWNKTQSAGGSRQHRRRGGGGGTGDVSGRETMSVLSLRRCRLTRRVPPAPCMARYTLSPSLWSGRTSASNAPVYRISGVDRSLVTVGLSFTVAKGLVPLGKSSCWFSVPPKILLCPLSDTARLTALPRRLLRSGGAGL